MQTNERYSPTQLGFKRTCGQCQWFSSKKDCCLRRTEIYYYPDRALTAYLPTTHDTSAEDCPLYVEQYPF